MIENFDADTFQEISMDIEYWVENNEIWNYDYVDIRITKDKHGWQATATIEDKEDIPDWGHTYNSGGLDS